MSDQNGTSGPTRRTLLQGSALGGIAAALGGSGIATRAAQAATAAASFTPANAFFNAHHSPIGAYASFTLGYPGANGGFGIEQKLPGKQSTFIGVRKNGVAKALPFFEASTETGVGVYDTKAVTRDFRVASDTFSTADFSFTLYSPVRAIPDPGGAPALPSFGQGPLLHVSTAGRHSIEDVLLPAIFAEMVVDNTDGAEDAIAAFAVTGAVVGTTTPGAPTTGSVQVSNTGLATVLFGTDPFRTAIVSDDPTAQAFAAATLTDAINGQYASGPLGGIAVTVPAGRRRTIRFALCFHRAGNATTGRVASYWYTRYYPDIEAVVIAAAQQLASRIRSFKKDNKFVDDSRLSDNQKFLLAQATHSYYGNTALLSVGAATPWWMVLEGQYQYMNTFDLTVDQLFFELGFNPWTVRNELDNVSGNYSYQSGTLIPAAANGATTFSTGPGGVSFTHDQGQWPNFSPDGTSAYEATGTAGTFSFMTGEQLTNWILIAGVYATQTGDATWVAQNAALFPQVLTSLMNRDNPTDSQRDGVESYNSTKTGTVLRNGQPGLPYEITTYDSVGAGLEEAVGNTYLGGKCFAAYLILQGFLEITGQAGLAAQAGRQAARFAATALKNVTAQGYISSNVYDGTSIAIIPVVEALVYAYFGGRQDALKPKGPYGALIKALKTHLTTVLDTGLCITSDGGWKLDSQSNNTWLSKIFLNEFVGRQVLGLDIRASTDKADAASVTWLTNSTSGRFAFSDQIVNQYAIGSEYYPRGVTAVLWLQEPPA